MHPPGPIRGGGEGGSLHRATARGGAPSRPRATTRTVARRRSPRSRPASAPFLPRAATAAPWGPLTASAARVPVRAWKLEADGRQPRACTTDSNVGVTDAGERRRGWAGRTREVGDGSLPARRTYRCGGTALGVARADVSSRRRPADPAAVGTVTATGTRPWRRAGEAGGGGVRSGPVVRRRPRASTPTDAPASHPRGRVGRPTPRGRVGVRPRALGGGGGAAAGRRAAAATPRAASMAPPPLPAAATTVAWLACWGERPVGVAWLVKVASQLPPRRAPRLHSCGGGAVAIPVVKPLAASKVVACASAVTPP